MSAFAVNVEPLAEGVMRFNEWGQIVTGWSAINIYKWAVDARSQRTLDDLRRERMMETDPVG